jgi:hypothetical protein
MAAAIFAGRLGHGNGLGEAAEAARTGPPASKPARAIDLLLDGLVSRFTSGYAAAVTPLRGALDAFGQQAVGGGEEMRWLWLACRVAPDVWDDDRWHELTERVVERARDAGALTVLPLALTYRAGVHVHAGEFAAAAARGEGRVLARPSASPLFSVTVSAATRMLSPPPGGPASSTTSVLTVGR